MLRYKLYILLNMYSLYFLVKNKSKYYIYYTGKNIYNNINRKCYRKCHQYNMACINKMFWCDTTIIFYYHSPAPAEHDISTKSVVPTIPFLQQACFICPTIVQGKLFQILDIGERERESRLNRERMQFQGYMLMV